MAHDVFISYSSNDKTTADAICESIEAAGLTCWIAPRNIRAGDTWGSAIVNAISESRAMVLILSSSANFSHQVLREAERAVQKDVVLIPVRIEEIDPSPDLEYFVSATHWYDAYQPPLESHLQSIADIAKSVVKEKRDEKFKEQRPKTESKDSAPKPAAIPSAESGTKISESRQRNKIIFSILALMVIGAIGFVLWNTDFFQNNGDLLTKEGQELAAPESVTAGSMFKVAWTGPNNSGDYITIVKAGAAEKTYLNYAYTKDGNPANLRALDEPGAYELRYIMGQSKSTLSRAAITVKAVNAELQAPGEVIAGSVFKVNWKGPNNSGDYITIVKAGAAEKTYLNYAYTKDGNPAKLLALDEPGAYELRYIMGQSKSTLSRAAITVKAVSAELQAPGEVIAGSVFKVNWKGPNNSGDYITIVKAGAAEKTYLNYAYTKDGNPAKLLALDEPGAYELRYIMGQSKSTLSRAAITVKAVSAELQAPGEVIAGSVFKVNWKGPNNSGDYITIVKAGAAEKTYLNYAYTKDGNPAKLLALDEPGAYELRYIMGQSKSTLSRAAITVKAASAGLKAPGEVAAGSVFKVAWTGPNNSGDYITIVKADAAEKTYLNYAYTKDGNPANLSALDEPGAYELRYIMGQSKSTLSRAAITVKAVSAELQAPGEVIAGSVFKVNWKGPNNSGDYITIVKAGAAEKTYLNYAYTKDGNPANLRALDEPGAYELRYIMGQSKSTLSRAAITVKAVSAGLKTPGEVIAGSVFKVAWTGPNNSGDYITIVKAGAAEKTYLNYAYTKDGNPANLRALDEPGTYELRYIMGQSRATLVRAPIQVRPAKATLQKTD